MAEPATDKQIATAVKHGIARRDVLHAIVARIEAEKVEREGWRLKYKAEENAREPEARRQMRNERKIRDLGAELQAEKARADELQAANKSGSEQFAERLRDLTRERDEQKARAGKLEGELLIANTMSAAFDRMKIASERIAELGATVNALIEKQAIAERFIPDFARLTYGAECRDVNERLRDDN